MDLVEFLRARLAEDERIAKAGSEPGGPHWPNSDHETRTPQMEHARRHDPARVLAEVEAKRRFLQKHEPVTLQRRLDVGPAQDVQACDYDTDPDSVGWAPYPCETLRILALPYADHPAYREEWRI